MAAGKQLKPHIDYLDDTLTLLKEKTDEAKGYLRDIRWQDLDAAEDREREFKFQATLLNSYVSWLNEYAKLSGVIQAFQDLNGTEEKEVRKGSSRSAFAEMIKEGKID